MLGWASLLILLLGPVTSLAAGSAELMLVFRLCSLLQAVLRSLCSLLYPGVHLPGLAPLGPQLEELWSEHLKQITARQAENGARTQCRKFKEVLTLGVTHAPL